MADTSTRVSGPVQIKSDSAERVALELAQIIASHTTYEQQDEKFWLTLYRKCWRVTHGADPDS